VVERSLIALALIALLALAIAAAKAWLHRRDARLVERLNLEAPTSAAEAVAPRIVYFTTTTCIVCRAQQEPALHALSERLPALVVERHDAIEDRALASQFSVLSVPTTAVYDGTGALVSINRGFTPAAVLLAQIEGRDIASEGGLALDGEHVQEAG